MLQNKTYSVAINASKSTTWDALWSDESYRKWTTLFSEGSHARSDWKEGSDILFLNGEGEGMHSLIAHLDKPTLSRFVTSVR